MQTLEQLLAALINAPQLKDLLLKIEEVIEDNILVIGQYRVICYIECRDDEWIIGNEIVSRTASIETIIAAIVKTIKYDLPAKNSYSSKNDDCVITRKYVKWFPYLAQELALEEFSGHSGYYRIAEITEAFEGNDKNNENLWLMRYLDNRAFARHLKSAFIGTKLPFPVRDAIIG